ncbi:MAG TPA: STAS domain-containing protein [Coleofasciculaceae cyanobacterium]
MNNSQPTSFHTYYPTRILSVSSSTSLLGWVQRQLEGGHMILLIDCRQVAFMDSTGLGTLITALKLVQKAEGRLALCSLGGQVRMLLEMAGMKSVFETFNSPADFEKTLLPALKSL